MTERLNPFSEAHAAVVGLCVIVYWATQADERGVPFEELLPRFKSTKALQWHLGVLMDIGMVQNDYGRYKCTVEPTAGHFGTLWCV
jgi:hypothetical protein